MKSEQPAIFQKPWNQNHNDIWLASSLSILRNIEKFKFPGKMSPERRKQILPLLTKELLGSKELINPQFVKAENLTPVDKEFFLEHFLSTLNFQGTYSGEGFVTDDTGEFLATLNICDHLHLNMIDIRGELEQTWNKLVKVEMLIGSNLAYAFSPRFGFLTSNPSSCGTGLLLSIFLQPTAMIQLGKIGEILEHYKDLSINLSGIQGSPTEIIGDVLMIRNQYTLGLTEENIISSLRTFATKLMAEEASLRNELKQNSHAQIKDKVSRAYGILIHSYQIDAIEALNAISLLKLGSELGWLEGTTTASLNQLFFNCRRAHLNKYLKTEISSEDLPHKRAEYIHESLKNTELKI